MRLFDRFDKVYCINLKRREDRFDNFLKQVDKFNLGEFTRFEAYDGKELDLVEHKTNLKPGELGLVLSNLDIIKEAKNLKLEKILIIEDDCEFTNEIKNINEYFKLLPSDWDMLYMGGNHNTHMGEPPPKSINEKVCKLHQTFSTHFIGIKNTVFDHIEQTLSKKIEPIDVSYTRFQKIFNVYSFYPAIAKQIVDFSDIQHYITDYNWLIK